MVSSVWKSLPAEIEMNVVETLHIDDVRNLSKVSQSFYSACLPSLFKKVKLRNFKSVERFLANVPRTYCRYIRQLELDVSESVDGVIIRAPCVHASTEAVNALLIASPCLRKLELKSAGSLDYGVVACFTHLTLLEHLTLKNVADETRYPLSERLVVSIAASIRNLRYLSIDRVSRSAIHAPELVGAYPSIPLVSGDETIPDHPLLGKELYLPSLLRIPSLHQLVIRDTHLGDTRWATTPIACNIGLLDVRSCAYESEEVNRACTERIMSAVGRTVDGLSIDTAVTSPPQPLPHLRKLYISEFHPVDSVVDTISNLSASPIESLSMQCFEDDVVDVCSALQQFLSLRVERGNEFFEKLSRIDVTIACSEESDLSSDLATRNERAEAMTLLQSFCHDLRLTSQVSGAGALEKKVAVTCGDVQAISGEGLTVTTGDASVAITAQ